ncbi:MAG: DNA replication and repair protein RecF, partial [Gammaproteobacteria bacterium]
MRRLEIENVRCIESGRLELNPLRNVVFGANGAGKTSILEAAHVLGRGHSFRVRDNRRLVREGSEGFVVRCERSVAGPGQRLGVSYQHGSLDVRIDGKRGCRATELAHSLPVEVIDPASHRLIDGSPGERRRFLDWALFHVEHGYVGLWREFRRVLVQRNEALRRAVSEHELNVWDDALTAAASRLEAVRATFFERWSQRVAEIGERLLAVPVRLEYRSGIGRHGSLAQALQAGRERERERGLTLCGPHRSDIVVRFRGGAARELA